MLSSLLGVKGWFLFSWTLLLLTASFAMKKGRLGSLSGNSNTKLDINTGVEGVMRGEKVGCAVGETGIHGVRLGIENLKTSHDK